MTALTREEATAIAKPIVVALCGGRWVSPPVRMTDEYPLTNSGRILLSGRPVREIHSVTVEGEAVAVADYHLRNGYVLTLLPARFHCPSSVARSVEVDYTYGQVNLPVVLQRAIDAMADQLVLASTNSNLCKIPERVTNVQRQGVSWTLLDPQDFLSDGRTGIYDVDLAIKVLNKSGARARARIFSHDIGAPALRRRSL